MKKSTQTNSVNRKIVLFLSMILICSNIAQAQLQRVANDETYTFINCTTTNLFPLGSVGTSSSDLWRQIGSNTNSIDGNYVQSILSEGMASNIYLLKEYVFDVSKKYDVYLLVVSPASQLWSVKAKLSDDTNYIICNKNTVGAEVVLAKDGTDNRIFRIFLGTVQGKTNLQVDFSIDNGAGVVRAAFDGIQYKEKSLTTNMEISDLPQLEVFPNPVSDYLMVKANRSNINDVYATDLSGRIIYQSSVILGDEHYMSTGNWVKGVYLIYVKDIDNKTTIHKVIKK